ncbi:hypothetical protein AAHA92_18826 [Salvia divinorum]|uniref:Uncharacterized protein n=1 Tax=Salvia divinorum TaxID=28513 RepID=A0ABD1H658_SALDI
MAYEDNPWGGNTNAHNPARLGGAPPTLTDRVGHTFGKTKEVASTGFGKTKAAASVGYEKSKVAAGKIKVGATVGFNWIRLKYKKSKLSKK